MSEKRRPPYDGERRSEPHEVGLVGDLLDRKEVRSTLRDLGYIGALLLMLLKGFGAIEARVEVLEQRPPGVAEIRAEIRGMSTRLGRIENQLDRMRADGR